MEKQKMTSLYGKEEQGGSDTERDRKLDYLAPAMTSISIELEQGIATGSVVPGSDATNEAVDEWDTDSQEFNFEWDINP